MSIDQILAASRNDPMVGEILAISSGTLATLTGETEYQILDSYQYGLVKFYLRTKHEAEYESWLDVWRAMVTDACRRADLLILK